MNVSLVTVQEKETINFYAKNSFSSEVKRMKTCYNSLHQEERAIIMSNSVKTILVDGIVGGTIGAVIGGGIGYVTFNLPGAILGGKIGAGIGGLGGACYGAYDLKAEFLCSKKYQDWIAQARQKDVYPIYERVILEDERFKAFMCPINLDLITIPVRAPDGDIYEQADIVNWIKAKEKEIEIARQSGYTEQQIAGIKKTISLQRKYNRGFGVNDLEYFPEYFKRLDNLVQIKICEMEDSIEKQLFQQAMEQLKIAQKENRNAIFHAQVGAIAQFVTENNLNPEIITKACRKLKEDMENEGKESKASQEKAQEFSLIEFLRSSLA